MHPCALPLDGRPNDSSLAPTLNLLVQGRQFLATVLLETPSKQFCFTRHIKTMPEIIPEPLHLPTHSSAQASAPGSIRRLKRQQRRELSANQQKQHAQTLAKRIITSAEYKKSQHIACYLANDGEISPHNVIEHAWRMNKIVYLPVLSPLKNSLHFAPYTKNCRMLNNRFGIPEPECHPSNWRKAWQLNLLFLPLVAFDESGNRMGMGGGFYDRTLAYLNHFQQWKKPQLVGLAHEIQKENKLTTQAWDVPLDMVVTELGIYR